MSKMKLSMLVPVCLVLAGCAMFGRDPFEKRRMPGTWCALGTSITWYNEHPRKGILSKGYQTRVTEVLRFDGYMNRAINGGTVVNQAAQKVPKAEYYTIEHGINDWGHSTPIGTIEEYRGQAATNTFYASYRKLIDKIRAANPNAVIILCTPRKGYGFGKYLPASSQLPHGGIYLREYADAVRAIAAEEGFQVADFYATCGEDAELPSLSIDVALHPNDAGFQRMADELLRAFASVD